MGSHSSPLTPRRRRIWVWIAGSTICALVVGIAALITMKAHLFGFGDSIERTAQQRCESDVRGRLASPSTASMSDVQVRASELDPESRDLFPLTTNKPLKGVNYSRITVWNVTGTVDAQTEVGSVIHDPFICRAYFVDDAIADTLVVFEHEH
ncbi:hypothetical protein [Mycolicibacterium peregrinum]|uniref:hypothetical protein n=2 Tax=Mycobacteriaceae TaxID=1762 RepID=UPI001D1C9540|nr:hypothetical protein [Mycobacterium sp. WUMAC-067]